MKKYLILTILVMVLLTGCGGIFNVANFVIPSDLEFIVCISQLDTVKKIVAYMADNFEYKSTLLVNIDPYELWGNGEGDCNDMSAFAALVANYNGIEVYQVKIMEGLFEGHALAVYKEESLYSFSSNYSYYKPEYESFREIVEYFCDEEDVKWISYKVYDYNNNVIENGVR